MSIDSGRAPSGQALVASDGAQLHGLHPSGFDPSRGTLAEEVAILKAENDLLRRRKPRRLHGDTIGELLDNQAWIILSHVASRIGNKAGNDELVDDWQDAWADGLVQKGFFTPARGVAAWIARHCELSPAIAMEASGRDGETRLDAEHDSAGRRHRTGDSA